MGEKSNAYLQQKPILESRLPSGAKILALALWFHIGKKGSTYVGITRLSEECSMTRKTVLKHLSTLKKEGVIEIRERQGYTSIYSATKEYINKGVCNNYTPTPSKNYTSTPSKNYTQSIKENQVEKKPSKNIADKKPSAVKSNFVEKKIVAIHSTEKEKKMAAKDVLDKYKIVGGKVTASNGKVAGKLKPAPALAHLWKNLVPSLYGINECLPPDTKKTLGMFGHFHKRIKPVDSLLVMEHAIKNWHSVCNDINVKHGLDKYPQQPSLPYLLKYCGEIASHYLATTQTVKTIHSPTKPKKVAQIKDLLVKDKDVITSDKLEDFSFFSKG